MNENGGGVDHPEWIPVRGLSLYWKVGLNEFTIALSMLINIFLAYFRAMIIDFRFHEFSLNT